MSLTGDQQAEIETQRRAKASTRRPTVAALEERLFEPTPVLDHGFVRVVDYMGDDAAVVQAARVSYGTGTRKISEDTSLIRYLMRHRHTTPFEMCEIKFHVKLPIFVARQWIRHRMANINEYSARYSILDREFYVPDVDHLEDLKTHEKIEKKKSESVTLGQNSLFSEDPKITKGVFSHIAQQSTENKQGRGYLLSIDESKDVINIIKSESNRSYTIYQKLLNEGDFGKILDEGRRGIARELARVVLPANIYTQWYWKTDLHNLLHFLSLRADPHAQYEIRAYAEAMLAMVRAWVPLTCAAFEEYRLGAATFSATMLAMLKRLLAGEAVEQKGSGLSKREWAEMMAALGREG
jgi:thymidylate synthase (FAD)